MPTTTKAPRGARFDRAQRDTLRRQPVRIVEHGTFVDGEAFARPALTLFGDSRGTHELVDLSLGEIPSTGLSRRERRQPTARAKRRLRRQNQGR
ncbi:hypothetical protein GXB85_04540 [Cellulomonas sp. APG4]|uniref:hypothetical protein n=1 Tax=Cellulomonas sp. APG4 TaxID=1538656 RepID=UPI00137B322E|nr:hypothetical protein [Cellulomonas sp. APG4]NCT90222.1 hypothetical protein [Cellulomonas sp. APG4]